MKRELDFKGILFQMINILTIVTTIIFLFSTILIKITNPGITYIPLPDILYIVLIGTISGLAFTIYYIFDYGEANKINDLLKKGKTISTENTGKI